MSLAVPQRPTPLGRRPLRRLAAGALTLAMGALSVQASEIENPTSLAKRKRPEPSNLGDFVADKTTAIALGKALFWDVRIGSDGKTACASCHFHAGADPRSKNQLSPGPNRMGAAAPFDFAGPNHQFVEADFPFHKLSNPDDRNATVLRSVRNVASSQGAYRENFAGVVPGQATDIRQLAFDPVFNVGGVNTRQVEPRQAPSVINAVFNLRNFWDGRAQNNFNGVTPWGERDADARVWRSYLSTNPFNLRNSTYKYRVDMKDSSLASQAVGPVLSALEMSAANRAFPDVGRKVLPMRPLQGQQVAPDDSVLGPLRHASGDGLAAASYADLVKKAFKPVWWNSNVPISVGSQQYNHLEANFSLYFGLALQLYQATLVSDQTPFDKHAEGVRNALNGQQLMGLGVFLGKGKCVSCHGGAVFTNAAIDRSARVVTRISKMLMGDGKEAVYDEGFYNIGITRTADDVGVGGNDPWGVPLSFSGLAKKSTTLFCDLEDQCPNERVSSRQRIAVNGSFKTPSLRNVELTAPYFHDGGTLTLEQVVEFYNRGANFARENIADLDADIQPLGLTPDERTALVAFLRTLTDERVRRHAAPFDHPELLLPNGHAGDTRSVTNDGTGRAGELALRLAAVGKGGYAPSAVPASFLGDQAGGRPLLSQGRSAVASSAPAAGGAASLAVDGNTNGNVDMLSVTLTNVEPQPWWQVDLGQVSSLGTVRLWNRTDACCNTRLQNFYVMASDTDMRGRTLDQLLADPAVKRVLVPAFGSGLSYDVAANGVTGRYVRVQLAGTDALGLAEVQVFGAAVTTTTTTAP